VLGAAAEQSPHARAGGCVYSALGDPLRDFFARCRPLRRGAAHGRVLVRSPGEAVRGVFVLTSLLLAGSLRRT
jgi:hypothetical protein